MKSTIKGILKIAGAALTFVPCALCIAFGSKVIKKANEERKEILDQYAISAEWAEEQEDAQKRLEVLEELKKNGQINHNDYFNEKRYYENGYLYGSYRKLDDPYFTACIKDAEVYPALLKADRNHESGILLALGGGFFTFGVATVATTALTYYAYYDFQNAKRRKTRKERNSDQDLDAESDAYAFHLLSSSYDDEELNELEELELI